MTLETEIPELLELTVASEEKFAPARVIVTALPGEPELGLIRIRVGASGLIVKLTVPLVPPAVVTLMFDDPVALAAMDKVAVI